MATCAGGKRQEANGGCPFFMRSGRGWPYSLCRLSCTCSLSRNIFRPCRSDSSEIQLCLKFKTNITWKFYIHFTHGLSCPDFFMSLCREMSWCSQIYWHCHYHKILNASFPFCPPDCVQRNPKQQSWAL